jgi:(1->4)-alpha-D-glucan 1-alpha-D-glucosylmutase
MLTTSTHDTKRGEDARVRIDVLSELPRLWQQRVDEWARINAPFRRRVGSEPAPHAKDEYLLYQVLAGSFPAEPPDASGLADFSERIQAYLVKALREGKERSSWRYPRRDYEDAVVGFAADLLAPGSPFLETFLPFQAEVARVGALNGLAQVALKLASPGLPDLYQGCEGWDLSLADPDNRRPVDFDARRTELEALTRNVGPDDAVDPEALRALRESWRDGRIKQLVTWRLLAFRRSRPGLFAEGGYVPLVTTGERAGHLCAFARTQGRDALLVITPRLVAQLPREDASSMPLGRTAWGATRVRVPDGLEAPSWRDVVSGAPVAAHASGAELDVAEVFATLPIAALSPERTAG